MPTIEDIFEKFGMVSEAAQLLEFELSTMLFRSQAEEKGLFENPRPELARAALNKINKKPLGELIKDTKVKIDSTKEIDALLITALKERNRLSHSFFAEHNFRLRVKNDEGRKVMLKDLESIHNTILEAYKALLLNQGIDIEKLSEKDQEDEIPDHVHLR